MYLDELMHVPAQADAQMKHNNEDLTKRTNANGSSIKSALSTTYSNRKK